MATTYTKGTIPPSFIALMAEVQNVVVLTGSGISAESGIPTFREAQTGLWAKYDPTELATPKAFRDNPKLVWDWYSWRRKLIAKASPNPGHLALAQLEDVFPSFQLITQNIDGLHARAGSKNIIELHGNIFRSKCSDQNHQVDYRVADDHVPPRCPLCQSLCRPDVIWFGEPLPQAALSESVEHAKNCDLFFSIGTSSVVQPAASLVDIAQRGGAIIIEINISSTVLTTLVDYSIRGESGIILPQLLSSISGGFSV